MEGVGRQGVDGTGSDGLGRSYRKGITLTKLLKMFPNNEAARK